MIPSPSPAALLPWLAGTRASTQLEGFHQQEGRTGLEQGWDQRLMSCCEAARSVGLAPAAVFECIPSEQRGTTYLQTAVCKAAGGK